jgi:hypothetical protein
LVCLAEDGEHALRFPIQGLTSAQLMGELAPLTAVPTHQLALPFTPDAWREMLRATALTGTNL